MNKVPPPTDEIRDLIAKVKRLELRTRKAVNNVVAGSYHSVFKGKGIEFEDVREYSEGDEIRDIDWKVSARMNKPFIKRYVEERQLSLMILLDVSESTLVGMSQRSKKDVAIEVAALLVFSAIKNGDKVGLLLFSDKEELHIPPRRGRKHARRLVREMITYTPSHTKTDLNIPLKKLMKTHTQHAIVFLISDFYHEAFEHNLTLVAKKHDLIAVRITEPQERMMPVDGILTLNGAENTGSVSLVFNKKRGEAIGKEYDLFLEQQRKEILRAGADLIELETEDKILPILASFFRRRIAKRK